MSGQSPTPLTGGAGSAAPPGGTNASACRAQVFATCVREQIDTCRHDAVKEFVGEKDNLKFLFDPPAPAAGSGSAAQATESKDSGGCQASGGAGGLLLVGAAIVGIGRRRRRARD
jgi:uncharacterized protein (TIGR03382 family)